MVSTEPARPAGMRTFLTIWIGQMISMLGSGLTGFALGVWIYQRTGQATPFALTALFSTLPRILIAPFAGALVDRWPRKLVIIGADTGAALATLSAVLLSFSGLLEVWHIYLIALVGSLCAAFQEPAFSASITLIVPREHYGRASGLQQAGRALEMLIPPVIAGLLFGLIGLHGIILIDFVTFFFAVGAVLLVAIPQPPESAEGAASRGTLFTEAAFGWRYIRQRHGLLAMLVYFAAVNFAANMAGILVTPMVLSFARTETLGVIQAISGAGMLAGSILMGVWGGPQRRMRGIYWTIALSGLGLLAMGLRPSAWVVAPSFFVMLFFIPLASGGAQAIWQSKVEPDVQGRVFATRTMIATSMMPLAYLLSGLLADGVFEPLMAPGGALAGSLGALIGVGQGRGMAFMLIISGLGMLAATLLAAGYRPLRRVEFDLPDVILPEPEAAVQPAEDMEGAPVPAS